MPTTARLFSAALTMSLLVSCTVGAGCATYSFGRAPEDNELRHDGSEAEREGLYEHYRVEFDDETFKRPGVAERPDEKPFAKPPSNEAQNYMRTSPGATEHLDSPQALADRFVRGGTLDPMLIIGTAFITIVATVGIASPFVIIPQAIDGDEAAALQGALAATVGGMFMAPFFAAAISISVSLVAGLVTELLAHDSYAAAADAFNVDLKKRIDRIGAPTPAEAAALSGPALAPRGDGVLDAAVKAAEAADEAETSPPPADEPSDAAPPGTSPAPDDKSAAPDAMKPAPPEAAVNGDETPAPDGGEEPPASPTDGAEPAPTDDKAAPEGATPAPEGAEPAPQGAEPAPQP